jgi:hypothetical protein
MVERLNDPVSRHLEPAAQIIPDREAELVAGLGKPQKRIPTIAANIAACFGAHFAPSDVAPDVIPVGVERNLRPVGLNLTLFRSTKEPDLFGFTDDPLAATCRMSSAHR